MNLKKRVLIFLVLCSAYGWMPNELEAFDFTDGLSKGNQAVYGTIASDLLTGDKMRIPNGSFCVKDNKLFVFGSTRTVERSSYSAEFVLSLVPGNVTKITVSTDHLESAEREDVIIQAFSCDIFPPQKFLEVESINGFTSYAAYLASEFVQQLSPD